MRGFVLPCCSNVAGGFLAACSKLRGGTLWYAWHPATNSSVSTRKGKKTPAINSVRVSGATVDDSTEDEDNW